MRVPTTRIPTAEIMDFFEQLGLAEQSARMSALLQ